MNILDKLTDRNLELLAKQNIPFVSSGSETKLRMRKMMKNVKVKVTDVAPFMKEDNEFDEDQFNLQIDEGRMSDIDAMRKAGATAAEIAKELKLPVRTVKDILGEELTEEEDAEKLKAELEDKEKEIAMLKQKAETEKAKTQKKETEKLVNPETGEPLLQVGIAYKHLKDKMKKEDVDLKEFKKMKVTFKDKNSMSKAAQDLMGKGFSLNTKGLELSVDGKGADLNKYATDLKNFYKAKVVAEGKYTRYSDLLIQLGRMKQAKDKQGEMLTQREIDKEKRKLGIKEADLSKSQIKKVHKMADELPKKDFKDRYGKEKGDAVRYATATNIVKKKLGIEESAAANEIQKNIGPRDGMDYNMYKKTVELLRKKDYKALGKHIYDAETAPREYVMGVISKKEPQTFRKMYGNQSGYYSLMKPLKMSKEEVNMKEHPAKAVYEQIKGLKNKAEKSGMPYSILKKVYDRGMAAWRGGHRPGTTQQQWAFARVNSFVTKSSGTWGGADKDLAAKVRGSK